MKRIAKKCISLLMVIVMLLGMLPATALAAAPSGTITAYLYYKVNGQVPADRNNEVQYNDTSTGSYGPSGDNTPMLAVQIDVDKLLEESKKANSPVEFADPSGWFGPDWYFRPVSASDEDVQAFWEVVQTCMTDESKEALAATGMSGSFIGYMLKHNTYDSNGYYVHMDGVLRVSTEDNTDVYVCELYDENEVYVGGLVTDSTKDASEDPTLAKVYDVYEAHFGMHSNTEWTTDANGASATYIGADGNRYRVTVYQTNTGGTYKPHDSSEISYAKKESNYYLAKFVMTREAVPYTVTYTDGLSDREAFKDQVNTGLYYNAVTPGFTGGTPKDPQQKLVFAGWSPAVAPTVTGDAVYTALWEEEKYTVTWLDDNGTVLEVDTDVSDGTVPTYNGAAPTKTGSAEYSYVFVGWSPAVTAVNGVDQIYTAVYRPVLNSYTVRWVNDDNSLLEVDTNVDYGTLPTYDNANGLGTTADLAAAKNTDQYSYRFEGWTPAVDFVTGDITYKATYSHTTNTYTVTWIDYNGNVLDTDTVAYGAHPQYTETEPARVPTAQYTYTFDGWKNADGSDSTVYASAGVFPTVTGNVTYQAQYTPHLRSFNVTLKLYLDNVLVNSEAVHGTALIPYISSDNGVTRQAAEHTATGTYVVKNVFNGVYGIYNAAGQSLCDQIIVVENGDVERPCYYYTVSYDGNGADNGVPAAKAYHLGDAVEVKNAPVRAGYIFRGWQVDGSVLQPNDTLTASITKTYTLVALWEKTVNVKVNVHLDHTTGSIGRDVNDEKDDVTIELVWRPVDDSAPWLEVPGTVKTINSSDHFGFNYLTTPDGVAATEVEQSNYIASAVTYANVDGGNDSRKFSVTFDKTNYALDTTNGTDGITAEKDSNGDWVIDLYLKYTTTNFDLGFSVAMDSSVTNKDLYPDAVIARVLYWDGDSWEIISQHDGGKPGVNVPIDKTTGEGTGKYSVWQADTSDPPVAYGYRFEVSAFVYDGQIVPYTPSNNLTAYSDGTYTATMDSVSDGQQYGGSLNGAYWDGTKQVGTLRAVIDVDTYQVTLNGNDGKIDGSETKVYEDQIRMPDVSGDVPVHTNAAYLFEGYDWYVDADKDGVADNSTTVSAVSAGAKLTNSYVLVAKWRSPWTVAGDITVDADYVLDGKTKVIQDADRIKSVTVLLQYAPAGSTVFTNKRTESVTITYAGDNDGIGSYAFVNVPNDGGTWRVHVLNHNYTTLYWNEKVSGFTAETDDLNSPCIAVDNDDPVDNVAEVDVKMAFKPETFNLYYQVIADKISESFRPTNAEVMVLYDATTDQSESPRDWPVISQMQDGTGYTGMIETIGAPHAYSVWNHHPLGHLYDYAIKVEAVDGVDLNGNEPYTIEYNGSAQYLASGGYQNQTQLLTATLKPKTYPVKYYLYEGSTVELHAMKGDAPIQVASHTWSFTTELMNGGSWKDVPARSGWVFTGWVDAGGTPVTSIDAAVQTETKLYATWEEDNWKDDPNGDSPTGGDGIPDSQQVRILYTTDGHGTADPMGEIVTITGGTYTDVAVTGDGSEAIALTGYAYDVWTYVGSSDSGDNATAALSVLGTTLTPTVSNADGGKTYTFKASFAEDNWKDDPTGDSPTGGDGVPDKYQAVVAFLSANSSSGTVTGTVYQVTTFEGNDTSGTVTPSLTGVTVNALAGWAFDYWVKNSEAAKLQAAEVEKPIDNVAGGTVIRFYANFAIDEWKDDPAGDAYTGGDDIPDYRQALVTFIPAANGRGVVTGEDAVQVFTLTDGKITPAKNDLTVTANSGYAFDYWSDLEGFWGTAGAKLTDVEPFQLHTGVSGGAIITYVAHFDTDNWDQNNDSETGGDGVPDAKQVLIRYVSNDTSKGTVSSAVEVISLTVGEKKGPEDISSDKIAGSTATALSGNAFDYWYSSRSNVSFNASAKTVDPAIQGARGGEIYTFTAAFGPDVIGGETGGDDIPDVYQRLIPFKVVNGDWNDGTKADKTVCVTLMKDGKWNADGSAALIAPAVGNEPDSGYKAGGWDVTPPATVTGTSAEVYTYTYKKVPVPPTPTPAIPSTGTVTLTKVDAVDALTTLSGVVFELYRANGTLMGTYTTGADGTITVSNLLAGKYYWVEIRPAEGYLLDASKHEFTVFGGRDAEISISNTRTPVPDVFSGDHYAYIIGRGDGLVHPEAYITRAEVATIFFRLLDDATREQYMTKENSFSDVEKGMWFNTAVSTMAAMGIVNGYPDGNFHPNANITRAEFAAIAARFDSSGNTTGVSFSDIYGHWAQKEINLAYNNGWILGYEDGTFKPNQNIIRAEAMTLINRVLQRVPEHEDDLLDNMTTWPDNMDTNKWYYLAVQEATNSHDYGRKKNGYEYWSELREIRDWAALEQ